MEKYPPLVSRRGSHAAPRPASAKTVTYNAKLREKAERSVTKMQSQMETEKRRQEAQRHANVARLTATWRDEVLPSWPHMDQSSKVRKLVAEGIPTSLRGTVWPLLLGNRQRVTPILYQQSMQEAFRIKQLSVDQEAAAELQRTAVVRFAEKEIEAAVDVENGVLKSDTKEDCGDMARAVQPDEVAIFDACLNPDASDTSSLDDCTMEKFRTDVNESPGIDANRIDSVQIEDLKVDMSVDLLSASVIERRLSSRVQTVNLIQWDIPRTFPTLSFFHNGAPLNQSLENVLMAYAAYRPDVGYVQGMSFLVAVLLLQMDEYYAFQCLVNLMKRRNQLDFYRLNLEAVTGFSNVFNHYFDKFLPLLYRHFEEQGMSHAMFLVDWNLTIFSKALPLECAIRIWDSYLVEGEVFVMRAAIGLLRLYAPRLSKMTMETIAPFLMRLPDDTNAADVFSNISEIKISHSNYNSICERHKFNPQEEGTAPMGTFSKLSGMLSPHVSNVSEGVDSQPKPIRKTSHVVRDFVSSFLSKQPNSA